MGTKHTYTNNRMPEVSSVEDVKLQLSSVTNMNVWSLFSNRGMNIEKLDTLVNKIPLTTTGRAFWEALLKEVVDSPSKDRHPNLNKENEPSTPKTPKTPRSSKTPKNGKVTIWYRTENLQKAKVDQQFAEGNVVLFQKAGGTEEGTDFYSENLRHALEDVAKANKAVAEASNELTVFDNWKATCKAKAEAVEDLQAKVAEKDYKITRLQKQISDLQKEIGETRCERTTLVNMTAHAQLEWEKETTALAPEELEKVKVFNSETNSFTGFDIVPADFWKKGGEWEFTYKAEPKAEAKPEQPAEAKKATPKKPFGKLAELLSDRESAETLKRLGVEVPTKLANELADLEKEYADYLKK